MKNKIILSILIFFLIVSVSVINSCKKTDSKGSIEGSISDAVTSQPVNGATVTLSPNNASATTGSDGKYSFDNIDQGDYTILASKTGYQSNAKDVTVLAGQTRKGDIAITPNVPLLSVNVTSLDFGSNLTTLPIEIRNTGAASLDWTITENTIWLSINPISGNTTTQVSYINVTVDRTGLSQGNYAQSFSITSNGGNATIAVSLNIANPNAPTVTCANAINISQTTAEVSGNITSIGSSNVNQHGHCWSASPNPTTSDNITTLGPTSATGTYASQLSGLMPNTTYYVRAYATNNSGTGYSTAQLFTTTSSPTVPSATTNSATSITETTASIIGAISNLGSGNIIEHGHCWSTSSNPTISNSRTTLGSASQTGNFTSSLSNLAPGTTYYVKAYATNSAGTGYSNEVSFSTTASATIPTLTTDNISNITMTGANAGATVTDLGNSNISDHGHCWSTAQNPTTSNTKTSLGSMNTTGIFSSNLSGLSQNTVYYVRAYATNSAGTAYGNQQQFTTSADPYIVSNGLIAFYKFDSQNATDEMGNYNGIMQGGLTVSTDIHGSSGYSMQFDGNSGFIQIPYTLLVNLSSATINVWVKTSSSGNILYVQVGNIGGCSSTFDLSIKDNKIYHGSNFPSAFVTDISSLLLNNQWHMLTYIYQTGNSKLYIDGILISQDNRVHPSWTGYNNTKIGYDDQCQHLYFNGKMDNYRIYNRILSQQEITQIYNGE